MYNSVKFGSFWVFYIYSWFLTAGLPLRASYTLSIFYKQRFNWKTGCQFLNFFGCCLILSLNFDGRCLFQNKKVAKTTRNFKNYLSIQMGIISENIICLKFCCVSHKNLTLILQLICHFMIFSRKIKVCRCLSYS